MHSRSTVAYVGVSGAWTGRNKYVMSALFLLRPVHALGVSLFSATCSVKKIYL